MSDAAEAPSAIRTAKGEGIESKSKPKTKSMHSSILGMTEKASKQNISNELLGHKSAPTKSKGSKGSK